MKCQTLSSVDAIYETVKPSFLGRIKIICHSVEFAERWLTVNSHTKTLFLHVSKNRVSLSPFQYCNRKKKKKKKKKNNKKNNKKKKQQQQQNFCFKKKNTLTISKLQNFWPVRHLRGSTITAFLCFNSMLVKILSRQHFKVLFLVFPQKIGFDSSYKLSR